MLGRYRDSGCSEMVVVLPESVLRRLIEVGLKPLRAKMREVDSLTDPDRETTAKHQAWRFECFERVVRYEFVAEPLARRPEAVPCQHCNGQGCSHCEDGGEVLAQSPLPPKREIKQVGIGRAWLDLLLLKRPDLDGNGAAWAVESAIADLIGVHRPMTPAQARQSGAALRGHQLKNKPALNPAGRTPKEPRSA